MYDITGRLVRSGRLDRLPTEVDKRRATAVAQTFLVSASPAGRRRLIPGLVCAVLRRSDNDPRRFTYETLLRLLLPLNDQV